MAKRYAASTELKHNEFLFRVDESQCTIKREVRVVEFTLINLYFSYFRRDFDD